MASLSSFSKCTLFLACLLFAFSCVRSDSAQFDGSQTSDITAPRVYVLPCTQASCKSTLTVRGSRYVLLDGTLFTENKLSYSELTVVAYWSNDLVFECSSLPSGAIGKLTIQLTGQLQNVTLVKCNVQTFVLDGYQQNVGSVTVRQSSMDTVNMTLGNFNQPAGFTFQNNSLTAVALFFNIMSSVKFDGNFFQAGIFVSNQINDDVSYCDNNFKELDWNCQNLPRLTFSGNKYTAVNFVAQNGNKQMVFTSNIGMQQNFTFNVVSNTLVIVNNTWCQLNFYCQSASNGIFNMTNNIANDIDFELVASTPVVFVNNTLRNGNFRLPLANNGLTLINNSFSSANFSSRIFNEKLYLVNNTYRERFLFSLSEVSNGEVNITNNAGSDTTLFFKQFTGPVEVKNNYFCNFTLSVSNGNMRSLAITNNVLNSLNTVFGGDTEQRINNKLVTDNSLGVTDACQLLPVNNAYCPPVNQPKFDVPFFGDVFA